MEQQRNFAKAQQELQSLTARYRGPLLEAVVDLENRLWHLANATSEWQTATGALSNAARQLTQTVKLRSPVQELAVQDIVIKILLLHEQITQALCLMTAKVLVSISNALYCVAFELFRSNTFDSSV